MKYSRKFPIFSSDITLYPDDYWFHPVDVFVDDKGMRGERVFCLFRGRDIDKLDDDYIGDGLAVLFNNCGVKSGIEELEFLTCGCVVPICFNGDNNPDIPLEWIRRMIESNENTTLD